MSSIPAPAFWLRAPVVCAVAIVACDGAGASERPERPAPPRPATSAPAPAIAPAEPPQPVPRAPTPAPPRPVTPVAAEPAPTTAEPKAIPNEASSVAPKSKLRERPVREIHPQRGETGCVEMHGTCTDGPDRICTTEAYALDCGEQRKLPATLEPLRCVCP